MFRSRAELEGKNINESDAFVFLEARVSPDSIRWFWNCSISNPTLVPRYVKEFFKPVPDIVKKNEINRLF